MALSPSLATGVDNLATISKPTESNSGDRDEEDDDGGALTGKVSGERGPEEERDPPIR